MKSALTVIAEMRCDFHRGVIIACTQDVTRAPRLYVPSKTQNAPGHDPVRMMTTLHYCEDHVGTLKLDDFLTDAIKAKVEAFARRARPIDWRPDFEAAYLHYVDIFSDEYKAFLRSLQAGQAGTVTERWGAPVAH